MVYRGGLENRFGRKPNGGSNPSLSANFAGRVGGKVKKMCELQLGKLDKF